MIWYSTKIIQIAGEKCTHYMVIEKQTLCDIRLEDRQIVLKYFPEEDKLCDECKKISRKPRIKDWAPMHNIENAEYAKSALSTLYLFYQSLPEEIQIGWGLWEFGNYGSNNLTNFLINDRPSIELVHEKNRIIVLSYRKGNGRENRKVSFGMLEEFMSQIKKDFLEYLQVNTN